MGGTTWTDARDSRLFILVLDRANINGEGFAALAAAYKREYQDTGIDNYAPTAKAIKEHIDKLKKKTSGGGGTPNSTPRKVAVAKTPTSSKTPTTARKSVNNNTSNATPSRSAKRKRTTKSSSDEMSDVPEEDTNDERKMLTASKASVAPRSSLSRRSKSLAKSYQQPSEDDEDEDADAEASAEEVDVNTTIVTSTAVNGTTNAVAEGVEEMDLDSIAVSAGNTNGHPTPQGKTANGKKGSSAKKRAFKRDVGDESDGSDFVPSFFE